MDNAEFMTVVTQLPTEDQTIFNNVEVYNDRSYAYGGPVEAVLDTEANLHVSNNLFESQPDLMGIKIENVDVPEVTSSATDDESMAIEALRELGNCSYKKSPDNSRDILMLNCPSCQMEFHTGDELHVHISTCQASKFGCVICNEVFERKNDLNNHLVCHAVDRPHSCRLCGTLFINKQDLQRHMTTHSDINSENQCQTCGQKFSRPSSLANHMKVHSYQPGRALISNSKIGTSDLADILNGDDTPQQKITLPSINNLPSLNNSWNISYDNFNLEVEDLANTNNYLDEKTENLVQQKPVNGKKPYECTLCTKSFAREKALVSHLTLHKDVLDNYYSCERCDQNFYNNNALKKHLNFCGVKLKVKTPSKLSDDNDIYHPPQHTRRKEVKHEVNTNANNFDVNVYNKIYKHSCTECGKNFTTKQKLFRHMWIHRKKVYSCELCHKSFEQQDELDNHRLANHQSGSPYVCAECGKNFSSRQGLWEHNRVHTAETNAYKCAECAKSFTSRQGYLIHKRKHSDERPYGCRFCWKAFRDGGTLRKHERIHTGERPHACPICLKAFNQKVVLREHLRCLHTSNLRPNDEGLFECTVCHQHMQDKDELCAHLVKHSDQMARLAKDASKSNITEKQSSEVTEKVQTLVLEGTIEQDPDADLASEEREREPEHEPFLHATVKTFDSVIVEDIENNFISSDITEVVENQCDLCGNIYLNKTDLSEHIRIHI